MSVEKKRREIESDGEGRWEMGVGNVRGERRDYYFSIKIMLGYLQYFPMH